MSGHVMTILSNDYVVTEYIQVSYIYRYKITQLNVFIIISVR